ncbi:PP2C family protein-serine/threonine phosphatase [Marinobacter caseinilyticus]|uniref:PP2C family protein-serine/threonine phosphatase n=1 Tax=Marinobacter caseinilyticus TaxID=2692195 RepID=UPI00140BB958|nr:protein phosphatase 2C domain-containing protein [Marinobacter caseinilyticus]
MTLTAAGLCDIGTKRDSNQDTIAWAVSDDGQRALSVVADGMGGYEGGEIASQLASDTVMEALTPLLASGAQDTATLQDRIQDAITLANKRIHTVRSDHPKLSKMGTTLVLAWVQNNQACIAHLGDSRCYLLSGKTLTQLTRDDTVAQNMVDDGSITLEEVPRVPFRNVLTRALGSSDDARASFGHTNLAPGDRLILCSDGLTGAVTDADWPDIMAPAPSLEDQARRLVDISLDHQAADNVSVVLVQSI